MIGTEYTPAQTRGQERWRVEKTVNGWCAARPTRDNGDTLIALNQFGSIRYAYNCMSANLLFSEMALIAERLKADNPVKRHGTAHSEARRLLCQRFADALNAELGA